MDPALRFTSTHEWIRLDGDTVRVGITDFAQKELGDIIYVECPARGAAVRPDDQLAVLESVKAAGDVRAPVAGNVAEINAGLTEEPDLINKDPYGKGWICALTNVNPAEVDALMTREEYEGGLPGKS